MPLATLRRRIAENGLREDEAQLAAAGRLAELALALDGYSLEPERPKGLLARFASRAEEPVVAPKGLYLHGGVGRGKSMLMDLFFDKAKVARKRRVHFHEFMLDVQKRLHRLRQEGKGDEPIKRLADILAGEVHLLCFDEFHVVNIADAMILGRLFERLLDKGVVVVATSNWPPDRLYENGLNRDRFLPFIALLKASVDVLPLDGPTDYRLGRLRQLPVYHHPLGDEATAALDRIFASLTDNAPGHAETLDVGSRQVSVPRGHGHVAAFDFADLCEQALGAADYLAITERYTAVLLDGVPRLTPDKRNEARRFMTLVDAFYERKVMLFVAAAAGPEALYASGDGAFEFQRTVSRLMEMRSADYLEACRKRPDGTEHAPFVPFALTSDLI